MNHFHGLITLIILKQRYVAERLGILKRIRNLLPINTRVLVVNSVILPLFDHGDLVWGEQKQRILDERSTTSP